LQDKPNINLKNKRTESLRTQVAKKLRKVLRLGQLPPGTRLTEKAVADMLGVSRTPAREALSVLAEKSVLDVLDQGGYIVPQLTDKDIDEMYKLRELIEIPAIKDSVEASNDEFIAELSECIDKLSLSVTDYETVDFLEYVLLYREVLFKNCGNKLLYLMISQIDNHTEALKISAVSDPKVRLKIVKAYKRILDAVKNRDIKKAVSALKSHHNDGRKAYYTNL